MGHVQGDRAGHRAGAGPATDPAGSPAPSDDAGEALLRAAFPKVGEWADRQQAAQDQREQDRAAEEEAEIAALPMADVRLSVTGDYAAGEWAGPLHLRWQELEPEAPDPEYPSSDPFSSRPGVAVDLYAGDPAPRFGELTMTHWGFRIPGFTGDGSYDLTAIAQEREPAALTYEEWGFDFADADDSSAYFYVDAGRSSMTVGDGGRTLSVAIAMSGARGALTATAQISRAAAG